MEKHVLVIEDEPNIIEAIGFVLSRNGWRVDTHSNGHDANDVIRNKNPDIIILDVMLPGKSGYDILKELRQVDEKTTPVLMLTARGQNKDREMAETLGVSQFMTKPFANSDLLDALEKLTADG
jgi:DNA-binding response OmpR family regulator